MKTPSVFPFFILFHLSGLSLFGQFGPPQLIDDDLNIANHIAVGDLNGDGFPDAIAASQGELGVSQFISQGKLSWYANDGEGGFGPEQLLNIPGDGCFSLYCVDIDNDGDNDLLSLVYNDDSGSLEAGFFLFENNGLGNFTAAVEMTKFGGIGQFEDMNEDGVKDVLGFGWSNSMVLAKGYNGDYLPPQTVLYGNFAGENFEVGDIDGDGDKDLLISIEDANENNLIVWFRNQNSSGVFQSYPADTLIVNDFSSWVKLADMDKDGDLDVVSLSDDLDEGFYYFQNNGSGDFGPATAIPCPFTGPSNIHINDINVDGNLDVIVPFGSSYQIAWFPQIEPGVFDEYVPVNFETIYPRNGMPVDFDGDGDLDYLVSNIDGKLYWFENFILNGLGNISGAIFWDENENGIFDAEEKTINDFEVDLEPAGISTWLPEQGAFKFLALSGGSHELTCKPSSFFWEPTTPSPVVLSVTDTVDISHNFGFKTLYSYLDAEIVMTSAPTRCGFTIPFQLSLLNTKTEIIKGTISLELDTLTTFISADPAPDDISGNLLSWSIDTLYPTHQFQVGLQLEMPGVEYIGEYVYFNSTAKVENLDESKTQTVVKVHSSQINCAYDPNDKLVEPDLIGDNYTLKNMPIDYTIRFQNTGTDTAFTVRIEDQLDENLNAASFEPLMSSHPCEVTIDDDNRVFFLFENILLPDSSTNEMGSHGFVKYRIFAKYGIPEGTLVSNTAEIYFDYNPPIITNTTENILVSSFPFSVEIDSILCNGDSNGAIKLTSDFFDVNQFSFNWSTGDASPSITDLSSDDYAVSVTYSSLNSVFTFETTLTEPLPLLLSGSQIPADPGQENGTASVSVAGGTFPYTYAWNTIPVQSTPTIVNLAAGEYSVTVTDANGCEESAIVLVEQVLSTLSPAKTAALFVYPNPSHGDIAIQVKAAEGTIWNLKLYNSYSRILPSHTQSARGNAVVHLRTLQPGIYFLVLESDEEREVIKVVVME